MPRARLRELSLPVLLSVLIVGVTALAAVGLHRIEAKRDRDVREERQAKAAEAVRKAFAEPLDRLEQVSLAITAAGPPSRPAFELLTAPMLRRPEVAAVAYIERVTEAERAAWERGHGFTIKQRASPSSDPAPARPVHYAVAAVASRTPLVPGTDLGAEASRVQAMRGATLSDGPVLTPPVPLFGQDPRDGQQIVAFELVRGSRGRRFVSAALTFDRLAASLRRVAPVGTALAIDDGAAPLVRVGSQSGPWRTTHLSLGGRDLRVRTRLADLAGTPWDVLVLLIGVLAALAVGAYAVQAQRRERLISAEVDARLAERRAVEADLDRERDFSTTLLSAMPDGFIAADNRGLIVVNDALCALTGFSRSELLGRLFPYGFWPEESLAEVARLHDRLDEHGSGQMELTLRTKDDRRIPVLATASTVEGAHGTIRIAVLRDNRERAAAARQLAESEAALQQLADAAPDVVARLSTAERIEWVSPSVEVVLGYAPDELAGKRFAELFEAGGTGRLGPQPCLRRVRRRDGRLIATEATVTPTVDATGGLTGMRASIRDVTEREEARAETARSEQRYRLLARALPDTVVFMVDVDRRFVIAEGGGLHDTEWTRSSIEGRTVDELLGGTPGEHLLPFYDAVLAGRGGEISHTSAKGRDYLTRFVPLRGGGGAVDGALVVATDVTALRAQQAARARADAPA